MKNILCSFLLCAAVASANPVNVSFVDAGNSTMVDPASGYDVGPYDLSIGNTTVAAMCMNDYNFVSGSWTANLTSVSGSDFSNTYLGNQMYNVAGYQFSSAQVYAGEAYLFSEIIQPNADRVDLQDAAWTIMDYVTGHTPHSTSQAVANIISDVEAHAGSFDTSGYAVLSQVNPGSQPEQEFIVATPEPGTLPLLAGCLLLAGSSRFFLRKRKQPAV